MLMCKFVDEFWVDKTDFSGVRFAPFPKIVDVSVINAEAAAAILYAQLDRINRPQPAKRDDYECITAFDPCNTTYFGNVRFGCRLVVLDVDQGDITHDEGDGTYKLKRATSLRRGSADEYGIVKKMALSSPYGAFKYADCFDHYPSDDTRNAALADPHFAMQYAWVVDRCPRDDTRNASLSNPKYAYLYASAVDKVAREDTRDAASVDPHYKSLYEIYVDRKYQK